jgi:hypothetical protein
LLFIVFCKKIISMKKIILSTVAILGCATFSIGQTIPTYVPLSGIDSWYSFYGNANDLSGGGNNGIVAGATLISDKNGKANSAYYFNGTSDYISLANLFLGGNTSVTELTYYIQFKIDKLPAIGQVYTISGQNSNWRQKCINIESDGSVGFHGATSGAYFNGYSSINSIIPNKWHTLLIIYSSSTIKLYLDGVLNSSAPISYSSLDYSWVAGGNQPPYMTNYLGGIHTSSGVENNFNGIIDDFGIWNRALTDCEISKLFLASNTFFTSKPADQTVKIGASASFTIKDTLGTSATYQWQENAGTGFVNLANTSPYSGVTTKTLNINPVAVGMHNNQYRCIRNSGTSCLDTSAAAVLTISNLGITPNQLGNLSIVPNPVLNKLNINAPCSINKLMLLNLMGQVVYTANPESNTASIDMSQYPTGIYILKVNDVWVEKIIKE